MHQKQFQFWWVCLGHKVQSHWIPRSPRFLSTKIVHYEVGYYSIDLIIVCYSVHLFNIGLWSYFDEGLEKNCACAVYSKWASVLKSVKIRKGVLTKKNTEEDICFYLKLLLGIISWANIISTLLIHICNIINAKSKFIIY